jgi:hypothetical protein
MHGAISAVADGTAFTLETSRDSQRGARMARAVVRRPESNWSAA